MSLIILRPEQREAWMDALSRTLQHDFYYLPEYHALAEQRGEGAARLYVYREGEYSVALPLLQRRLADAPGLEAIGEGWQDATSVYGYAGPIASHARIPRDVLGRFHASLAHALAEQRIVTAFSRLHPLIGEQCALLDGIGERLLRWHTISIDLTLPADAQLAAYRQGHRYDIRKLRRAGMECLRDTRGEHLQAFVAIYHETMRRVRASESYFFDQGYFERLLADGETFSLFVGLLEGRVVCGALFSLCDGIVQYHLAGTRDDALRLAPMKLLLDEARRWATERGARVLHLGGGLGPQEDSLFKFKAGFSDRRHEFAIWRWVLLPDVYAELCAAREVANRRQGLRATSSEFFPQYRCPAAALPPMQEAA